MGCIVNCSCVRCVPFTIVAGSGSYDGNVGGNLYATHGSSHTTSAPSKSDSWADIRKRLSKVTGGRWVRANDGADSQLVLGQTPLFIVAKAPSIIPGELQTAQIALATRDDDADFILHAKEDITALLLALDTLERGRS